MEQRTQQRNTMTRLATLDPPIMSSTNATAEEYPGHANVLALVSAYTEAVDSPMPWATLVDVIESLQLQGNPAGLQAPGPSTVDDVLGDIVTDLRRLNLLRFGVHGTTITDTGEEVAKAWNGQFTGRRQQAAAALRELRVIPD